MSGWTLCPLEAVIALARSLDQAPGAIPDPPPPGSHPDFIAFPRMFGDTSLGFGGMAGQSFTAGLVVVAYWKRSAAAAVFVGGRLAYVVRADDPRCEDFWRGLTLLVVPERVVWQQRSCDHLIAPETNYCQWCGLNQAHMVKAP